MIIVNFSTKEYRRGQQRLSESIPITYKQLMFTTYQSIGSPTHQESPYEFKIHAIEKAAEVDPLVLWADSSMQLIGDLKKIEQLIMARGYYMEEAGHYVGRWCNDFTKKHFRLTDDELKQEPGGMIMFSAGLVGLDFRNGVAIDFFTEWKKSAIAGCFRGSWENHRHDMTAGSIVAQRKGMKYESGGSHLAYVGPGYAQLHNDIVFTCQGL